MNGIFALLKDIFCFKEIGTWQKGYRFDFKRNKKNTCLDDELRTNEWCDDLRLDSIKASFFLTFLAFFITCRTSTTLFFR